MGVLPAVQLHAWDKALLYLASFCLTSIFIMGAFAGLWGEMSYRLGCARRDAFFIIGTPKTDITKRIHIHSNRLHWREKKVAFGFQLFSAALSLTVGVLWLVLKSLGLLEKVFG